MVLKHENRHHWEGLLKHRWLGINSRVSSSGGLRWGSIVTFLTSSQVILMLLFQGPAFENHCLSPTREIRDSLLEVRKGDS